MATLELRFLGEMDVVRDDAHLELPPSKKTRALLAYLALTGRPHRRERLCQLLWDVADDPRGALRWSLSRLRSLVDEPEHPRIQAPRDRVEFVSDGAWIDVEAVKRRCASGLDGAPLDELTALARQFRGELLEGLELDDFLDFRAWCVAEREEARKLHVTVLRAIVGRLEGDPEAVLPYARVLAGVEPLDHSATAGLIRALGATGRRGEAEQRTEAARRLQKELGHPASSEIEEAWKRARDAQAPHRGPEKPASPAREGGPSPPAFPGAPALVGRRVERRVLAEALDAVAGGRRAQALLLTGEPGLGKSRLLEDLRLSARERGATVLEGRAFEAESGRPFGPWIDALRQLPGGPSALRADLGAILPEHGESTAPQSRDRLFEAVVEVLAEQAASTPPVLLTLDDVHWLDAASAELLHFVARVSRNGPLLVVMTARAGELSDNEAAQRTLWSLRDLGLLEEIPLAPLGAEETRDLVAFLKSPEAMDVYAESGGNPLLALEVARAMSDDARARHGQAPLAPGDARIPGSLVELIRHRVERLPAEAGDVLRWASVLGRGFDFGRLSELMALDVARLLGALELLERHALVRPMESVGSRSGYEFGHEVVRRAIYSELSHPRRRLMHLRIAQRLGESAAPESVAAELAHHAALAGDSALAARACVRAGRLFLRQFANGEAWAVARRGRRHAAEVPEPERTALLLDLIQVELQARRPADVGAAASELATLAELALAQGDAEHGRLGFHMLAYLRWDAGDHGEAQRQMLRAERVARAGGEREQVLAMAEAARCLVLLERELPRAEALALEANARSAAAGLRPSAIADAQGLLRFHQGELDAAAELFERARIEARQAGDAMDEFSALEHLVVLLQQRKAWSEARDQAVELEALGVKLREGSEAAFARALVAISSRALGEADGDGALEAAVQELRLADAKLRLAYSLTRAARLDLEAGDARRASLRAEEALHAAGVLGRPTEMLLAGVTLARARWRLGEDGEIRRLISDLRGVVPAATVFARRDLEELLREHGDLAQDGEEPDQQAGGDR